MITADSPASMAKTNFTSITLSNIANSSEFTENRISCNCTYAEPFGSASVIIDKTIYKALKQYKEEKRSAKVELSCAGEFILSQMIGQALAYFLISPSFGRIV